MQNNWSYLSANLPVIAEGILYSVIFIGLIWQYVKERNYPLHYRVLNYLGSFMFFMSFHLGLIIGNWLDLNRAIIGSLIVMLMGVGTLCVGIALNLLPESYDVQSKKKNWKFCVGLGLFFILVSIYFTINVIFNWFL